MRSPLPDSSNLEAGIVEDARPSRLSRVHDNVRDILRRSVFGSVTSTPVTSPTRWPEDRAIPTPPIHPTTQHTTQRAMPMVSPPNSTLSSPENVPGVLFPAWRQQPCTLPIANNESQTPTPRDHPDLSQNTMSLFLQQKELQRHQQRQHKAWKRPKSRKSRKSVGSMQWVICIILGFAVLGLLGTCKSKPAAIFTMPQMLTIGRYRTRGHILGCFGDATRHVCTGVTPHQHCARPHLGQTMLSQHTEDEEKNCQDRAGAATKTPPSASRCSCDSSWDCRRVCSLHSAHAHTCAEPRLRPS